MLSIFLRLQFFGKPLDFVYLSQFRLFYNLEVFLVNFMFKIQTATFLNNLKIFDFWSLDTDDVRILSFL